jgi:hypothetical protein
MNSCNFWFKYKIKYSDEVLYVGEYGLDKHDTLNYLKNSLNMSMEYIEKNIDNLDDDDLQNVAEWVAHGCLSMDQMLSDVAYENMDEFSRVIAKRNIKEDDADFDEVCEEIFYDIGVSFTSVELKINDKIYVGK